MASLIPFPSFESNLAKLIDTAHDLHGGEAASAKERLRTLYAQLRRVKRSPRHQALAAYVGNALSACGRGEHDCALATVMSALSSFIPERAA
jgi:hypothetical protein